jgi:hypothetical protein
MSFKFQLIENTMKSYQTSLFPDFIDYFDKIINEKENSVTIDDRTLEQIRNDYLLRQ